MRRLGWLFLAGVGAVGGCQPSPVPMSDAQRQAVAREVRAQVDSFQAGFRRLSAQPFLDQLADNEFYGENGTLYPTRDSLLSAMAGFPKAFTALELAWDGEPTVSVLGPDAAVISGRFHEVAQPTTGPVVKARGVWTGVYQKVEGKWRIVQAHESYVPDEPAAK